MALSDVHDRLKVGPIVKHPFEAVKAVLYECRRPIAGDLSVHDEDSRHELTCYGRDS